MGLKWRTLGVLIICAVILSCGGQGLLLLVSYFFILSIESSPVHQWVYFIFPTCGVYILKGDQRGILDEGFRIKYLKTLKVFQLIIFRI